MSQPRPLLNLGPRDDYVYCSSRGASRNERGNPISILEHLSTNTYHPHSTNHLLFNITTGSKIDRIVNMIISKHQERGSPENSHAYIIGGYCDITYREKINNYQIKNYATGQRSHGRYEEVSFMDTIKESYTKAIHRYTNADNILKSEGIRPCFATVPPSSLEKWNDYRLFHGNTSFLIHESQYKDMQEGMNEALTKINGFVCKLNALNGMDTPYLAGTVVKTWSKKNRDTNLQRHKLYDGVHADDKLIKEWATKLQHAIDRNRSKPDNQMPRLNMHTPRKLAWVLEGIKLE